jgi:hypothetical protein
MQGTERMRVKVVSMGNPIVDKRKPCNMRPVTLEGILAYIENTVRDERVREEVKKAAVAYPYQALPMFGKNIRQHIERAQKKIALTPVNKGELGEEAPAKESIKYGKEVF